MIPQEVKALLEPENVISSIPVLLDKVRYGAYIPRDSNYGVDVYNECLKQVQLIKFLRTEATVPALVRDYALGIKFEKNYDECLIQFDSSSEFKTRFMADSVDLGRVKYNPDKFGYVEQKINRWFAGNYLYNLIYGKLYNYTKVLKLSIRIESYSGAAFEGTYVPDKGRFLSYFKGGLFARLYDFPRPDYEYRTRLGLSVELDSEFFNIDASYLVNVRQDNQGHLPALQISMLYNLNPEQLLTFKTYAGNKILTL